MKSMTGILNLAASLGLLVLGPTLQPFMQNLHLQQVTEHECPNCSFRGSEDPSIPSFFNFPAIRHHDHHNCAFCSGLKNFQPSVDYSFPLWTAEFPTIPAAISNPVISDLSITLTRTARAPPRILFST
ncbi:MAG: hypothetical protein K8S62_01140 [Candidatus Sabulitectum sp.]|nr:hypothetical protein [Candidatus Sabulitectum sp.]